MMAAMFLHRLLDEDARRAFARLAHRVLQASGGISATEARVLYVMLAELELDVGALEGSEPLEHVVMRVRHPRARMAALLELYRLAYADGDMRSEEQAFVRWAATCWGMDESTVGKAEGWARQHDAMVKQAAALIDRAR